MREEFFIAFEMACNSSLLLGLLLVCWGDAAVAALILLTAAAMVSGKAGGVAVCSNCWKLPLSIASTSSEAPPSNLPPTKTCTQHVCLVQRCD